MRRSLERIEIFSEHKDIRRDVVGGKKWLVDDSTHITDSEDAIVVGGWKGGRDRVSSGLRQDDQPHCLHSQERKEVAVNTTIDTTVDSKAFSRKSKETTTKSWWRSRPTD